MQNKRMKNKNSVGGVGTKMEENMRCVYTRIHCFLPSGSSNTEYPAL